MLPPPTEEQLGERRRRRNREADRGAPRRRDRLALALLVVGTILFFTRQAVLVPFTVGWPAARMLVQSEAELASLRAQAAEYRSAARYLGKPAGQDYARKLVYNQQDPGERRMQVEPVPESKAPSVGRRIHTWLLRLVARWDSDEQQRKAALKRWLVDPPVAAHQREGQAPKTEPAPLSTSAASGNETAP